MRNKALACGILVAMMHGAARGQAALDVPIGQPLRLGTLGVGGNPPAVATAPQSPTGVALSNLQPASYVEWKVACNTPGLYRIEVVMGQWQDPGSVLAFETRPFADPEDPYATRYAAPVTRDYGQTIGANYYAPLGFVEDAGGNTLTVPLWNGENVLRVQNVTGRHHPAETIPTDMADPRNREWDTPWSNVRLARIRLIRVADLPVFADLTGQVVSDRPAGAPVRRALALANPPGGSPLEPSHFWKSGYYTLTADDGAFTLSVPEGEWDVKAGRPGSYRVQGSDIRRVDVNGNTQTAAITLPSLFGEDAQGRETAAVQLVYSDAFTGTVGLNPQSGENGYKVSWFNTLDACSVIVDAPRAGLYNVVGAYLNGNQPGVGRVSTDLGQSATAPLPVTGWGTVGHAQYSQPLYLAQGPNVLTQSLVSGDMDPNALHLTRIPTPAGAALSALRIAAGLQAATPEDAWMGALTGDPGISLADALLLLRAAG